MMDAQAQLQSNQIIKILNQQVGEYVLFYYGYQDAPKFYQVDTPTVLLPKEKLSQLVHSIRNVYPQASIDTSANGAEITFTDQKGDTVQVNCVHRLLHNSWCLLDEDEVSRGKRRHRAGFYIPSMEHLFEYAILQCWMECRGLADRFVRFFEEFHVLVQEDLLDYFNQKYMTTFGAMEDLSIFQQPQLERMMKVLQNSPENGFMDQVKLKWFGGKAS